MPTMSSMPSSGDELTNPLLTRLPDATRLLALGIRSLADPHGRWILEPQRIRLMLWPHRSRHAPRPTETQLEEMILQLDEAGWLTVLPHPDAPDVTIVQITGWQPTSATSSVSSPSSTIHAPNATSNGAWAGAAPERSPRCEHGELSTPLPAPLPEHPGSTRNPRNHAAEPAVNKSIVGGGSEREWERDRAHVDTPPASPHSTVPDPAAVSGVELDPHLLEALRMPPSSFCRVHPHGPPPGVLCPDCGTARGQATRHAQLRTARRAAEQLPSDLRRHTLQGIDAELRALEDAATTAHPRPAPQTLPGLEHPAHPDPEPDDGFDESPF